MARYTEEEEQLSDMEEDTKKPVKQKEKFVVVKELPMQQVRETMDEDGTKLMFITTEEALMQILNK